jgi:hypothetical protein
LLNMEDPHKAKEETQKTAIETAKSWGGKPTHILYFVRF